MSEQTQIKSWSVLKYFSYSSGKRSSEMEADFSSSCEIRCPSCGEMTGYKKKSLLGRENDGVGIMQVSSMAKPASLHAKFVSKSIKIIAKFRSYFKKKTQKSISSLHF